jgi:hypothetical protein
MAASAPRPMPAVRDCQAMGSFFLTLEFHRVLMPLSVRW